MQDAPETRPSLLIRLDTPGDQRAWVDFLEIYEPLIRRVALRKGLQPADADDLTQEVLRSVAAAIGGFDRDPARGSFRGWLFRIARNQTLNFVARQHRGPRGVGDTHWHRLLDEQKAPAPEDSALFREEYERRLFRWAADRVRGEFTDKVWQAFWLAGVEGRGPRAVAEELGISIGTVYNYKSRVMARLRRAIEQGGMDDGEHMRGDKA